MSNTKRTKNTSSKITNASSTPRKTPPYVARDFKNEVKIGSDGKPWVSLPNKNMNYSWQPYGGTSHDKYIEKAAILGDISSLKNLDDESKPSKVSKSPNAGTSPKKVSKKAPPKCDSDKYEQVNASEVANAKKKPSDDLVTKSSTSKTSTSKYTKKTDKSGRIMYYNVTGKRTAKKNVPEEYL